MDPLLNTDQQDYQQSLRKFLDLRWTDVQVRASMEGPHDEESTVWRQLTSQLGIAGLLVPEEFGGTGWAPTESLLVAEELGRALYGGPYFGTVVLGINTLLLSEDQEACEKFLPELVSGESTATFAPVSEGRDRNLTPAPVAQLIDGEWTIDGSATRVVDADSATYLLVEADTPNGRSIFLLDGTNVNRNQSVTLDPTRRLGDLHFDKAPAQLIGEASAAERIKTELQTRVLLALSAEAVGGAAKCVEETVAYAKIRHQFGRPIGSFQAVKHRCAEMQVRLEGAQAGVRHAGDVALDNSEDLALLARVLKVFTTESYFRTAADTIQLHGGIGFTWEHFAHLHFKRAKSLEIMWGTHHEHRAEIANVVLASK